MSETLILRGCAPIPLASYLKALGVLRLIASPENNVSGKAADPEARGWWQDESFHLETALGREGLEQFFLEDYAPTPLIAAWNGRAGFLEGEAGEASSRTGAQLVRAIENSGADRLREMRAVTAAVRREPTLQRLDHLRTAIKTATDEGEKKRLNKKAEAAKSALLPSLRASADPQHLRLIDAAFVLTQEEEPAPLLGSGFNDGSRDFGVNFAEALERLIDFRIGNATVLARRELPVALFEASAQLSERGTIGQFGPGQGGVNATTGYAGDNALNPWDLVLVLEGALTSSGALSRRFGVAAAGRAAFPFTFEASAAGAGGLSSQDPNRPRAEIWTPLWRKPASALEVAALFAEGRLTLGRAPARSGLEAARAISQLGIARGIHAFERYSLLQPDSKMPYQATPLGRFRSPDTPHYDLIADLETGDWLNQVRRLARDKNAPARARQAVRRLEDALFLMTDAAQGRDGTLASLEAIGGIVAWLSTNREARDSLAPPPRLHQAWVNQADDGTAEFRVAAALASLGWPESKVASRAKEGDGLARPEAECDPQSETTVGPEPGDRDDADPDGPSAGMCRSVALPMAAHFAPVDEAAIWWRGRRWTEEKDARACVWGTGDLTANLLAVLERRLVERARRGLGKKPFGAASTARLADIAAFLAPGFDDARCARLLAGLVWARPAKLGWQAQRAVPFAFAALKPLFTEEAAVAKIADLPDGTRLPVPPGLVTALRRGNVDRAMRGGLARARASGLASPFDPARAGTCFGAGTEGRRLAAALLIPLAEADLARLIARAYPQEEFPDHAA